MSKLRYTILIVCILLPIALKAQRRFEMTERWKYRLEELRGFTTKDVSGKTDAFWGLHASQYVGSHHLVGFSVEGAWSSYANNMPATSITPGGWATGFHLLYEYQYSGLLFQTGIGVNLQNVYTNVMDTNIYHYHMHDTWEGVKDAEFTLKHRFYDRQDFSRNIYGQLPFYVGQYILGHAGVGYYLAGLQLNYAFSGSTRQKLIGTTLAQYEPFLGIWHEMDNHGYRRAVPIERHGDRLKLKMDVLAHAEIGYEYTTYRGPHNYRITAASRTDIRIRFAGFIDFGVLNINPRTDNVLCETPIETIYDFPTYRMDHIFSTRDAKAFWMRNLYAGIRITVLVGFPGKEKCILCDPWKH